MKRKNIILTYLLLLVGMSVLLTTSCYKLIYDNNKTVTDIDGNVYTTITIGTQVWMVENLKTTTYRNGQPIPKGNGGTQTDAYLTLSNLTLYNWSAVLDNRNIAPTGWHVPTDLEWATLVNYLGGESIAGGKLKETGTAHWLSPNLGATNETGFTALPGTIVAVGTTWYGTGDTGYWWSSSVDLATNFPIFRTMSYNTTGVNRGYATVKTALPFVSVRCIKD